MVSSVKYVYILASVSPLGTFPHECVRGTRAGSNTHVNINLLFPSLGLDSARYTNWWRWRFSLQLYKYST